MTSEPTTIEKIRGIPWSIATFAANTFFVQFTFFGSVFPLFLAELGLSKGQMGFLFSLMPFLGLIAPFIGPWTARFGYKRTFLTFFGIRKIFTILLLLTPWVQMNYGIQTTLIFVSFIVAAFALCRSIAETARIPWAQEYVPRSMQGKYTATNNFFTSLAGFGAVGIASYVLGLGQGLTGFMILIAGGVFAGMIGVWCSAFIPGGAPHPIAPGEAKPKRNIGDAFRDHNFLLYLGCVGIIILATVPVSSFIPLYMTESVGLTKSSAVLLQIGTLTGTLVTSYLWGWVADRYGSKPVMILGIALRMLVPLALIFIPRNSFISLYAAVGISLFQGIADMGWGIGSTRLLYIGVVPPEKKADYMALYFAWIGVLGGISQLAGGRILDLTSNLSGSLGPFPLDPYTPLFLSGIVLMLLSLPVVRMVNADNDFSIGQFAGIFLRGNPFLAMGSLIRYQAARSEEAAVLVTERLGEAKSLLTVDELLDALHDPRFQVRVEAVISIARMPAEPRLIEALGEILHGTELALSTMAAWALGRIGSDSAIPTLEKALDSPYQSIRAHAARALGKLQAGDITPLLHARLQQEADRGLQMAYASALGNLMARNATSDILDILYTTSNPKARLELALALARLVGNEHRFIQLVRASRTDLGTGVAQALAGLKKKFDKAAKREGEEVPALDECITAFARNQIPAGIASLVEILPSVPSHHFDETSRRILAECTARLAEFNETHSEESHLEYLLLTLHVLDVGWHA
ncbi:MAG: MFS transporter [Caldilineaceae bacterium]|nr:MFS transporter [Caldilineaceae bacterium]